jgi:hypothetical protein
MSATDHPTYQYPINRRTTGYFENSFFISHQDPATTTEMNSYTYTSTPIPRAASAPPEWYYEPGSLDHLNPAGVRAGASFPALQNTGSKTSRARDSVDENDDKFGTPRKRRRLSPIKYIKVSLRRLWPTPVNRAPLSSLPLTCGYTQSETALGQYPLDVYLDHDESFMAFWESRGYSYNHNPRLFTPPRPRTYSSPPVMAYCRSSDRVRWWEPSARQSRHATLRQSDRSGPAPKEDDMLEPVLPVTQIPASPRLEGESKEDDLFTQMDALKI